MIEIKVIQIKKNMEFNRKMNPSCFANILEDPALRLWIMAAWKRGGLGVNPLATTTSKTCIREQKSRKIKLMCDTDPHIDDTRLYKPSKRSFYQHAGDFPKQENLVWNECLLVPIAQPN